MEGWVELSAGLATRLTLRPDGKGHRFVWRVLRVALDKVAVQAAASPEGQMMAFNLQRQWLFAVNGGYFETDRKPSGLLQFGKTKLGSYRKGGGTGLLVIDGGRARLLDASRGATLGGEPELALQSGPRLVETDGKLGITSDPKPPAARSAVCLRQGGHRLDFVITWDPRNPAEGPSLLQLAEWLSKPDEDNPTGCEGALNLDGGPSAALVVPGRPELAHSARAPVPFALVGRSR